VKRVNRLGSIVLTAALVAGLVPVPASAATAGKLAPASGATAGRIPAPGAPGELARPYVRDEVIVRFAPGAGVASVGAAHARAGAARAEKLGKSVPGLTIVKLKKGQSVAEAVAAYEAQPGVLYAQPNTYHRINGASVQMTPSDPKFPLLWGLKNTGQTDGYGQAGIADADIDADEAWGLTTGSSAVKVAVIDTGVDREHPELDGQMWVNIADLPNNGLDDDSNGYVDDTFGWDAVNTDGDPYDDHGHGTHVSGTIGGEGDNGVGVTGVNWDVTIVAIKAFDSAGTGTDEDCIEAIEYAAEVGADVVNCSWSGGGTGQGDALSDAIAANGALFACATGNESHDLDTWVDDSFPAEYDLPNVIAVAASDNRDVVAEFSNYGATAADIAAPGVQIWSSIPGSAAKLVQSGNPVFNETFSGTPPWFVSSMINDWGIFNDTTFWSRAPFAGHADYVNDEQSAIILDHGVDISSLSTPALFFKTYYDTEEDYDYLNVYMKDQDGTWWIDKWYSGWSGTWVEEFVNLDPYRGETSVTPAFELWSDGDIDSTSDGFLGVFVDDVRMANSVPDYTNAYDAWDGTSMATPHVAGVAALLKAYKPDATTADIKAALLAGADVKTSLAGKVAGNRRLNAKGALDQIGVAAPAGVVTRIQGADRYVVAAAMARKGWDPSANGTWPGVTHVIVANGETGKEADPLSAAGLAGAYNAPVLLTQAGRLPSATRSVITQLAAKRKAEGSSLKVHLIGGTASLPDARWNEIKAIPGVSATKDRLAGADRYQVSANIATRIVSVRGKAAIPGVLIVAADNPAAFYDALAVSPAAYAAAMPMLAVKKGSVPISISSVLNGALSGKPRFAASSSTYIGTGGLAGATRLTSSSNRYTAATQIATNAVAKGWLSPQDTGLAAKLPDALTGGAFLGKRGGVMLFTDSTSVMQAAPKSWITARGSQILDGWVLGGTASVPSGVQTTFAGLID